MVKDSDNGVVEFQFQRREPTTKWQSIKKAIYDPSTSQFLGRTPKNWGQLLIFYTIFYVVLAALFAICMQGLFATLNDDEPKWKLEESLIGKNPGLGFRPISAKVEEGSLIAYNVTRNETIERWIDLIDEFLRPYQKKQEGENYAICDFNKPPKEGQVCKISMDQFGSCNEQEGYGYRSTSPCVFLKLNRIFDWKPEYFTETEKDMPQDLVTHIKNLTAEARQQIWVTCEGEDDVDKELVSGFNYYPRGFAGYFYPYKNNPNYLSPLIAVQIKNPKPNILISIECRAWAKNIEYRSGNLNRAGSVRFEVRIDREVNPIIIVKNNITITTAS